MAALYERFVKNGPVQNSIEYENSFCSNFGILQLKVTKVVVIPIIILNFIPI